MLKRRKRVSKKYTIEDLGFTMNCPVCQNRMINSVDIKYNYDYGICSSCYITYFESIEKVLKEKEKAWMLEHEDKIVGRDMFRSFCVQWAKEIKEESDKRQE